MNCKEGDLVRYVGRTPVPNAFGWIGRVIRFRPKGDIAAWTIDPPIPGGSMMFEGRLTVANWAYDTALCPIGKPSDDAVDEVIQRLGKPVADVAPPLPTQTKETV